MDQDETWHGGRPLPWPHCVRLGPSSPSPKGHSPLPQFYVHVCCGQMAGWIKMPLGMEVNLCPGNIVLDRDPTPPATKGEDTALAHVLWPDGCMDQDATRYGGRPQPRPHCITWGPSCPLKRTTAPPLFGPCLLWPNGWMDQDTTWYGDRSWPRPHWFVLDWAQLPERGTAAPPSFQPTSIVAKRSPISAAAELLLIYRLLLLLLLLLMLFYYYTHQYFASAYCSAYVGCSSRHHRYAMNARKTFNHCIGWRLPQLCHRASRVACSFVIRARVLCRFTTYLFVSGLKYR